VKRRQVGGQIVLLETIDGYGFSHAPRLRHRSSLLMLITNNA
jgi:hypothetical protein